MTAQEEFKNIIETNVYRDGIKDLMDYLDRTDFYIAPASTRFHGSYPGGLVEHSVNVYKELKRLIGVYPEIQATEETLAIISLFHDLCKANTYKPAQKNRKNSEGKWESYMSYDFEEQFCFGGHGSKSVFMAQYYIKLTSEEATAINCHMGIGDGDRSVSAAYEKCNLAWLLHVADESATFVVESKH